ncbi:peptidase [Halobacillus mangrovi]|uniref:Acetylornithine deacetylase n=1 Tax=Halobacillus mangrovi TaxID=402384 RepID=A0A1W5ZZF3_9BACI|nr:peptidase [Halobacillus mangrovi]ARI78745.1 acetylornithine deacetylase [Halobacillus mangrovi]
MEYIETVRQYIENHRNDYTTLLQEMVQQPSTAGNERGIQNLIADRLEQLGLQVDKWQLDYDMLSKHEAFCASRNDFEGSENVVGTLKGSGNGRSIILNGHVDVVPEGDLEQWEDEPFSGTVKGDQLFGRGATDMKGGNLASLVAIEAIKASGIQLKGDILYQSVVEEESGGSGTLAAIERGYRADAALIPEPTNMRMFPKQQGSIWFRVFIHGKSAHGGTRYKGVSAIAKSNVVYEQILFLEKERNEGVTDPLYKSNPIPIPINIGRIEGGNWPSSVPDQVVLEGRMGIAPGESIEKAKKEFENHLAKLSEIDEWFAKAPVKVEWFGARWLPGEIDEDHDFMKTIRQAYENYKGKAPQIEASPWGTDGGLLTQLADIPVVVFGPGETNMAHYPNEYIDLNHMFDTAAIIAETLILWCGVEQ